MMRTGGGWKSRPFCVTRNGQLRRTTVTDFEAHLTRQIAWSRATFGPSTRTEGVLDHITKEIAEVRAADPEPKYGHDPSPRAEEWVDIVILALDGLTRQLLEDMRMEGATAGDAAEVAVDLIVHKQSKNEMRDWPDWRTMSEDKAIEHVRTPDAAPEPMRSIPIPSEVPTLKLCKGCDLIIPPEDTWCAECARTRGAE